MSKREQIQGIQNISRRIKSLIHTEQFTFTSTVNGNKYTVVLGINKQGKWETIERGNGQPSDMFTVAYSYIFASKEDALKEFREYGAMV